MPLQILQATHSWLTLNQVFPTPNVPLHNACSMYIEVLQNQDQEIHIRQ